MDPNQHTSGVLLDRANADIASLLRRFENILAFTPDEKQDRNATAVGAYQMEVETAALVRAAEDILSLTRILKEAWLFGKLQTVGVSEAENRAEEAARKVAEGLSRIQQPSYSGAETKAPNGETREAVAEPEALNGESKGQEDSGDP